MNKHLHIITHDIPYPVSYGGVVDLYYKIKTLHALGINIHLHCYHSQKKEQPELLKYCNEVHYYPRKKSVSGFSLNTPYIVQSRNDARLLKNLSHDDYPVLIEGIHCSYLLKKGKLEGRKVFIRLHNVEFKYYSQLAKHESNILKKAYFTFESFLLKKYERSLAKSNAVFISVSIADATLYRSEFQCKQINFLPVFLPWSIINVPAGKGCFCLYHGNLSINENEKAADWLLNNVFNTLDIPLVIAGKDPSLPLQTLAHSHSNTCIVINPTDAEMQDLINKAQVNILPSFNKTGIKLKLLNALYNGRHCLVNNAAIEGTGIENLCVVAETAHEFKKQIEVLFQQPFSEEQFTERQVALGSMYHNEKNGLKLITWIY